MKYKGLDSLNNDYRRKYKNYPIHHMQERIKKKESIEEKLRRKGYRSLHIIVGIRVYHIDGMDYYPVEIQMRTMAMDLWASMEHRVCYKKLPEHRDELAEAFCQYADILGKIEEQFEAYNETGMLEEITPAQITENPTEG